MSSKTTRAGNDKNRASSQTFTPKCDSPITNPTYELQTQNSVQEVSAREENHRRLPDPSQSPPSELIYSKNVTSSSRNAMDKVRAAKKPLNSHEQPIINVVRTNKDICQNAKNSIIKAAAFDDQHKTGSQEPQSLTTEHLQVIEKMQQQHKEDLYRFSQRCQDDVERLAQRNQDAEERHRAELKKKDTLIQGLKQAVRGAIYTVRIQSVRTKMQQKLNDDRSRIEATSQERSTLCTANNEVVFETDNSKDWKGMYAREHEKSQVNMLLHDTVLWKEGTD
jgi:hypothetical protein